MIERKLVYEPSKKKKFKKSPLYIFSLAGKVISICAKLLFKSLKEPLTIKSVDEYIKNFWQLNFDETNTKLYVTGLKNIDKNKTYIYMSNHESWMDMPSLFATVPQSLRMISKEELMRVPVLGKAMYSAGFVPIDRKNRQKAITQLEKAKELLKNGVSLWLAPEGTRSRDGNIKDFKKGGFYIALDLQIPIVPVYIEGAGKVIPPDSFMVNTNNSITVHFLRPVEVTGYKKENLSELVKKVRDEIIEKKISLG